MEKSGGSSTSLGGTPTCIHSPTFEGYFSCTWTSDSSLADGQYTYRAVVTTLTANTISGTFRIATPDAPTFSNIANEYNQVVLRGDVGSPLNVICTSSGGYPVQTVVLYFDVSPLNVNLTGNTNDFNADGKHSLILTCKVGSSNPAPTIQWYNGTLGGDVISNSQPYTDKEGQFNGVSREQTLDIYPTRYNEGQSVTCSASNNIGNEKSATINLNLHYSAIISSMIDQTAREGDTNFALKCQAWSKPPATFRWYKEALNTTITGATDIYANGVNKVNLTCNTGSSNPSSSITWYRDSQLVTSSKPLTSTGGEYGGKITSQILEFVPTREMDGHVVECRAGNEMSSSLAQWARVALDLKYDPSVSVTTGSVEIDETQSGSLSCTVDSKPPSTITWTRVDRASALPTNRLTRGSNSLEYTISTTQREDAGQYRCTANNNYGGNKHNDTLIVVRFVGFLARTKLNITKQEELGTYNLFVRNSIGSRSLSLILIPEGKNEDKNEVNTPLQQLQPGTLYYIRMHAENNRGKSGYTRIFNVTLLDSEGPSETSISGAFNPSFDAAQTYEDVSMTTGTSVYDALKNGNNGPDDSHVYTPLADSSSRSHVFYENVKKEDPVYNNTVMKNPAQTVL
ncbi:CADM2-like protein [Mya arenaria]|uniref:CADM2-like protein n=1 Tax=Mya arenaria TaxID=6604 RepID=A0ABY7EA94_MYAAR|nr:CADM2-like protein [Mya arenaria]